MGAVVADTHSLVWHILNSPRLSENASRIFQDCATNGYPIYISAITLVEMCYLIEKGRLPQLVMERLSMFLEGNPPSVLVAPLDKGVALAIKDIPRESVPDMPDRIIAATAHFLQLPLVARDSKIRATEVITIW